MDERVNGSVVHIFIVCRRWLLESSEGAKDLSGGFEEKLLEFRVIEQSTLLQGSYSFEDDFRRDEVFRQSVIVFVAHFNMSSLFTSIRFPASLLTPATMGVTETQS